MSIISHTPKSRQTLLFSATMPPKIQQLAGSILKDPAEIKLAVSKPADKIMQLAYLCSENQKEILLRHVLNGDDYKRVIVFSSSKLKVKQLARNLRGGKLKIGEMHSDLDQNRREDVMLDFKAGKINVLVATDIVARGIDIDDIELVVNYDVPREGEDYVHRVGRTARADRDGKAVTLVGERDRRSFQQIEKLLGKKVTRGVLPPELVITTPQTQESNASIHKNGNAKGKERRRRNGSGGAAPTGRPKNPDERKESCPDSNRNPDRNQRRRRRRQGSRGSNNSNNSNTSNNSNPPPVNKNHGPAARGETVAWLMWFEYFKHLFKCSLSFCMTSSDSLDKYPRYTKRGCVKYFSI